MYGTPLVAEALVAAVGSGVMRRAKTRITARVKERARMKRQAAQRAAVFSGNTKKRSSVKRHIKVRGVYKTRKDIERHIKNTKEGGKANREWKRHLAKF